MRERIISPGRRKARLIEAPSDELAASPMALQKASCIDAVCEAREVLLNELDARRSGKQVDRATLVKTDGRMLEPLLCFFLRTEHVRGLGQDFGKLPGPPTLLLAQRLVRSALASLKGAKAHSEGFFQRVRLNEDEVTDEVGQRRAWQSVQQQFVGVEVLVIRRNRMRGPPSKSATFCRSLPGPFGAGFSAAAVMAALAPRVA